MAATWGGSVAVAAGRHPGRSYRGPAPLLRSGDGPAGPVQCDARGVSRGSDRSRPRGRRAVGPASEARKRPSRRAAHRPPRGPVLSTATVFIADDTVRGLTLLVGRRAPPGSGRGCPGGICWSGSRARTKIRDGHSYRSGFWTTLPLPPQPRPGLAADPGGGHASTSGAELLVPLGRIEIVAARAGRARCAGRGRHDRGLHGDVRARARPVRDRQVDSLRAQTDTRWTCVISDGGSSSRERFRQIEEVVGDDRRFVVSRSRAAARPLPQLRARPGTRAGGRGSDRALRPGRPLVPGQAGDAAGGARARLELVYSDQRLVGADGRVLRDSLWNGRRNDNAEPRVAAGGQHDPRSRDAVAARGG